MHGIQQDRRKRLTQPPEGRDFECMLGETFCHQDPGCSDPAELCSQFSLCEENDFQTADGQGKTLLQKSLPPGPPFQKTPK